MKCPTPVPAYLMSAWRFLIRKLIKKGWETVDVWSFGIHPAVCLSSGQESVAHFQPRENRGGEESIMRLRGDEEDVLGPSEGSGAGFSADRLQAPPSQITGTRAHGTMRRIPWGVLGSDFSLIHTIGRSHWYFLDSDLCPHVLQFGVGVVVGLPFS